MIEPVSAESLRKTGIFADKAGDFRRFPPQDRRTGSPETKLECAKSRDFRPYSAWSVGAWPNAGMAGWGGRDRTSEWRNQNPLPYRLATPQQAGTRRRIEPLRSLPATPVYRGSWAISTGRTAEFRPKSGPVPRPLSIDTSPLDAPGGGFHPSGPPNTAHLRVESTPVSWEDGSADSRKSEISS